MPLDANLGSKDGSSPGPTVTLTTTAAAASSTRVVVTVNYWTSGGRPSGITIGGVTATKDLQVINSNGQDTLEVWSAPMPSGLASGSSIILTAAGTGYGGLFMEAISLSGVDMTSGGGVAGVGSSSSQTGTSWTTGTASAGGDTAVGGAGNETASSTTNTMTTGTETFDIWNATQQQGDASGYNTGGTSLAGTWSTSSTATTAGIVGYSSSGAVTPSALPISDPAPEFGPF